MGGSGNLPDMHTARLVLRDWTEEDLEPFARLNADPAVMEHFPSTLTRAQSDDLVRRIRERRELDGLCFWAVEVPDVARFIGMVGLAVVHFDAPFAPAVEIGWRIDRRHWGSGYATEGAVASLRFAFDELGLDRVVSFTVPANTASLRVMEKIGMRPVPGGEFEHPALEPGHRLRHHVLHAAERSSWSTPFALRR
jgi:RimJ/RimL family protein N-acetyltransferase